MTVRFFLIGLSVLLAAFFIYYSGLSDCFTLQYCKAHLGWAQALVAQHYGVAVGLYIFLYMISVILCIPAGIVLIVTGSFLFGLFPGLLYANIGATLGALISFFIARYLIGQYIHRHYQEQLKTLNHELHQHGALYLLTLHLIPVTPFAVLNYCAGLTRIKPWPFLWTTALGILPGSLLYGLMGQRLATLTTIGDIFTPDLIIAFLVLKGVSVLLFLVMRFGQTR